MVISDDRSRDGEIARLNSHVFIFRSIEQLNEEYEDYKPTEPIIKDEKIRKAVRAWAEANRETELKVTGGLLVTTFEGLRFQLEADFRCSWTRNGTYTITELCGEEE